MWNILDFQWIQTVFVPEVWDVTPTSNRPHHTHDWRYRYGVYSA